jgi:Flp pilus assembly pilin Flp
MKNRFKDNRGVTTIEYAIMLVLIALVVAGSNPGIANAVTNVFARMTTALTPGT